MTAEELIETALSLYKDGDKVNQRTAYDGNGAECTLKKVSPDTIHVTSSEEEFLNVVIDSVGVYHSKYGIWATVLNRPQESLLTRIL